MTLNDIAKNLKFGDWELRPVVTFWVPELVRVPTRWAGHPVIKTEKTYICEGKTIVVDRDQM